MDEPGTLTATAEAVRSRRVSAAEVVGAALARLDAAEPVIHAFLEVFHERAIERAGEIDARIARGEPVGPLAGVPIAVKDNLCLAWGRTTCASRMLDGYESPFTATAVQRLIDAGAVIVGKTNLDEFAMGSSTEHSAFGPTRNPWDPARIPGGSSGGSAAAVAAGVVPAAIGSDTGGSIRQPASHCGVVGVKPTYGRVSRYGLVAFASSLDQVGPMARNAADAGAVLCAMSGADPLDATSADAPSPRCGADFDVPVPKLVLGVPRQARGEGNHPAVSRALDDATRVFQSLGASLRTIDLPHTAYGIAAYYIVATAEASSNLARFDGVRYGRRAGNLDSPSQREGAGGWVQPGGGAGNERDFQESPSPKNPPPNPLPRGGGVAEHAERLATREPLDLAELYRRSRSEGFGPEVQRRIMLGTHVLSSGYYDAYYTTALKARRRIKADYDAAFAAGCHAVLMPVAPTPAYRLGEKVSDPLAMYLEDVYTVGVNLAGLPAVAFPAGMHADAGVSLPIGLQLIGAPWSEETLLRIARMFEAATPWAGMRPPA